MSPGGSPGGQRAGEQASEPDGNGDDAAPMESDERTQAEAFGAVPRLTFDDGAASECASHEYSGDRREDDDMLHDGDADDNGSFTDLWKQLHAERHQAGV